jgi:Ca-activated chloride channel homolog
MKWARGAAAVVVINVATVTAAAFATPGQDAVFRAAVSLVKVDAEVAGKSGVVDGLQKQDFVILDNGRPQTLRYFSQSEEPLDAILLFDISASMGPSIRKVANSAQFAMSELRHGDRVAVMSFNTGVWLEAPFSEDLSAVASLLLRGIRNTHFGGGTYILDGVDEAAKYFQRQPGTERRRAVLAFTDDDGHGFKSQKSVTHDLWEADAILSGLIIGAPSIIQISGPHLTGSDDYIEDVAAQTGGDVVRADPPGPAFREMLLRMRKRYSLYYPMPPGKPGQVRRVTVELSPAAKARHPDAAVLARKGYIVTKAAADAQ